MSFSSNQPLREDIKWEERGSLSMDRLVNIAKRMEDYNPDLPYLPDHILMTNPEEYRKVMDEASLPNTFSKGFLILIPGRYTDSGGEQVHIDSVQKVKLHSGRVMLEIRMGLTHPLPGHLVVASHAWPNQLIFVYLKPDEIDEIRILKEAIRS